MLTCRRLYRFLVIPMFFCVDPVDLVQDIQPIGSICSQMRVRSPGEISGMLGCQLFSPLRGNHVCHSGFEKTCAPYHRDCIYPVNIAH